MKTKQLILSTVALAVVTSFVSNLALAVTADDVICTKCVGTDDIANFSISKDKIKAGAVTLGKIRNNAVIAKKIANGAVKTAKIATGAVTSTKIANFNVTNTKIGSRAVTGAKLATGAASVSHVAFVNENTSLANAIQCKLSRSSGYAYYLTAGAGTVSSCDAYAPIQIPDGVTITGLNCTFYDNNGANSLNASLRRVNTTGGVQVIASTPSTVNSTSVQTVSKSASFSTPLPNNLVDNNTYSYNIFVSYSASDFTTLGANARMYRCEVRYNQIFKIILPL
ncbi:MAG: hypothetical protein IME94_06830 [Proteobacteria bacterium]|nr:hypothetical protein [Pseudomonadota bacterium]